MRMFSEKSGLAQPSAIRSSEKSLLVLREGRVLMTPQMAAKILEETHFDGQRTTDPVHVQMHMEVINRGLWLERSPIAFCKLGFRYYLVNGKHRTTAVSLGSRSVDVSFTIHECESMDDVVSIYARYDSIQRGRSSHQVLAAVDLAGQLGVGKGVANAVYAATPLLANGLMPMFYQHEASDTVRARMGVTDLRVEAARSWASQAVIFEKLMEPARGKIRQKVMSAACVAVALLTLKHSQKEAEAFFGGIAANDGLRRGDPRHTLVQYMLTNQINAKSVMWVGLAWNAFYANRRLSSIRFKPDTPVYILGTPLDGRRR